MNVLSIFIISFEFVAFIISLIIFSILCLQKNKNQKDKDILWIVFLGALLLISDCLAEFYKGNTSEFGYVMTHLCNPLVFMFNYLEMGLLAKYLYDSLTNVLKRKKVLFHFIWILVGISVVFVVLSQYFEIYYYFDANNIYHRTKYFPICQIPTIIGILIFIYLLYYFRNDLRRNELLAAISYVCLPTISTIIQIFFYGLPLQAVSIVISGWLLFLARELDVRNQLEEAMKVKTDFLNRMSHDIRTPLNGILGLIEIDSRHPQEYELLKMNRTKAKVAANYLLSLLNDMLQLSKLESQEIKIVCEPLNIEKLFDEVFLIAKMKAENCGITLQCQKDDIQHPYLMGSSLYMKQILLNVLDNSIKYNKKNGSIAFSIKECEMNDGKAMIQFDIQDTGIGMSEEFIQHIFEPFVQEHENRSSYQGSGIGMAIVLQMINMMHGTIDIQSALNVGSHFMIRIPFEIAEKQYEISQIDTSKNVSITGVKVLLAEDNALNREIAKTLLEDNGAVVYEAVDGKDVVTQFMQHEEYFFDIILMDIMMPVMNGYEACKALRNLDRKDAKDIPVVACSANAFEEDIAKSKESGMAAHLTKPLKVDELIQTIAKFNKKILNPLQ